MNLGTVDSFNDSRGFGFIISRSGDRFFVHRSGIKRAGYRTLKGGERITFDVEDDLTGRPRAVNVQLI